MDNREMDRLIAEKVMGWHAKKDLSKYPNAAWYDKEGKFAERAIMWDPSENVEKAWQVVEKLGELGYWAQLRTPFDLAENTEWPATLGSTRRGEEANDGYWCGFTPHLTTGWNGRPDHWTSASTITMAICLAALEAIGVEIK